MLCGSYTVERGKNMKWGFKQWISLCFDAVWVECVSWTEVCCSLFLCRFFLFCFWWTFWNCLLLIIIFFFQKRAYVKFCCLICHLDALSLSAEISRKTLISSVFWKIVCSSCIFLIAALFLLYKFLEYSRKQWYLCWPKFSQSHTV